MYTPAAQSPSPASSNHNALVGYLIAQYQLSNASAQPLNRVLKRLFAPSVLANWQNRKMEIANKLNNRYEHMTDRDTDLVLIAEDALVTAAKAGRDAHAWVYLYFFCDLVKTCRIRFSAKVYKKGHTPEDLAQDAFLTFFEKVESGKFTYEKGSLGGYLFKLANGRASNIASSAYNNSVLGPNALPMENGYTPQYNTDGQILQTYMEKALAKAKTMLGVQVYGIVELRMKGLPYEDIAHRFDMNANAAKTAFARAKRRLQTSGLFSPQLLGLFGKTE